MIGELKRLQAEVSAINRPLGDMVAYRTDWEAFSDAHAAVLKQMGIVMTGLAKLTSELSDGLGFLDKAEVVEKVEEAVARASLTHCFGIPVSYGATRKISQAAIAAIKRIAEEKEG